MTFALLGKVVGSLMTLPHSEPLDSNDLNSLSCKRLEQKFVHSVYAQIAQDFSKTRYKPWPKIVTFIEKQTQGDGKILVDIGCGNGKYIACMPKNGLYIGLDYCEQLLVLAKKQLETRELLAFKEVHEPAVCLILGSAITLPIKSCSADVVICVATLHHISSVERRALAIKELLRIVKPGSTVLIYVWAKEQEDGTIGARRFETSENFVPWLCKNTNQTFVRYYYVFTKQELIKEICNAVGNNGSLTQVSYDSNNWCAEIIKIH